jgi:23S rRNA (uracil1939-C5)-methyltransferase
LHFKRKPRPKDSILSADLVNNIAELSTILMKVEGYGLYDPLGQAFVSNPPLLSQTISLVNLDEDINLTWEAGGFCQVNLAQNKNLINLVLDMTQNGPHNRVLDLYCGYGNFSLAVAHIAEEVIGIDGQNSAIRSGKRNTELNDIHNCHFEKKQVVKGVKDLIAAKQTFDTVILDPPRQGAVDIVPVFPGLEAAQIIYISCNPATLARDLAILCSQGYALSYLVPVDMFPHTHHIESVALLKRLTQ